jgi:hypothetical protein
MHEEHKQIVKNVLKGMAEYGGRGHRQLGHDAVLLKNCLVITLCYVSSM